MWAKGLKNFKSSRTALEVDHCFRLRYLVTLQKFGAFQFNDMWYYCRGVARCQGIEATITWKSNKDVRHVRLYVHGRYRGIASVVVMGSRAHKLLKASYTLAKDECLAEDNVAGAIARKLLKPDKSSPLCAPEIADPDAHEERARITKEQEAKALKTRERDEARDAVAEKMQVELGQTKHNTQKTVVAPVGKKVAKGHSL